MSGETHSVANEGGNNNGIDFDRSNITPAAFIVALFCAVPVITLDLVSVRISLSSTIFIINFNDDGNGTNFIATTTNNKNSSIGILIWFQNAQTKIEHMFIEYFFFRSLLSFSVLFEIGWFQVAFFVIQLQVSSIVFGQFYARFGSNV